MKLGFSLAIEFITIFERVYYEMKEKTESVMSLFCDDVAGELLFKLPL